ncbi:MAG: hypothetical protein ABIT01_13280, partial [Thermoanaerobaculia bacterium]
MQITLPWPHPGQCRVLRERRRFNVLSAGRRWRKTTGGLSRVIPVVLDGGQALWGAPVYDQVMTAYDELARATHGVFKPNKTDRSFLSPTGGRIILRSLDDPDNARSKTAHIVVLDEAGDCHPDAWKKVIRPMLMDTLGEAWIIGTPKGRNWFWEAYRDATDPDKPRPNWAAWQIPSLGVEVTSAGLIRKPHPYENTDLTFSELVDMYEEMTEQNFRQEVLAEFIEDAGGVFRGVTKCATAPALPREPYEGSFVIGVDWGKSHDFTVLTCLDTRSKEVVDHDRFNKIDWEFQRARLEAMYLKWNSHRHGSVQIVAEQNSIGDVLIEALRKSKLPVHAFDTNNLSKQTIIEDLSLAIERQTISYPPIVPVLNELQAYQMVRRPSGLMTYSAPPGDKNYDDCVISLALAYHAVKHNPDPSRWK